MHEQHNLWEAGIEYGHGCVVSYDKHCYRIIQPHRSQGDWTPDQCPALWGKLPAHECNLPHHEQYQHHQEQVPEQPHHSGQNPHQTPQQPPQYSDEKHSEPAPEHKHWYEDDSTKKKLGIGAGLVGGAALLAGGVFAYKKHEEHKEEAKAGAWARTNWIDEARARTEELQRRGPSGPAIWVLTHGKNIPKGAIVTGQERGQNLYSSRAFHEGALVIGKASERFQKGCLIGYGNDEIEVEEFEVLVGDMHALRWVSTRGRFDLDNLRCRPVEGGREKDGTPVYIVHAPYKESEHPGKTSEKLDGAYITYGGKEKVIDEYQVLCYK